MDQIDQLRRELAIIGDNQTIAVDETPAGRVVRALMVPGGPPKPKDRIFTTGTDDDGYFTIAWPDFYVWTMGTFYPYTKAIKLVPAGTFRFTTSTSNVMVYLAPIYVTGGNGVVLNWQSASAVGADSFTIGRKGTVGIPFQYFNAGFGKPYTPAYEEVRPEVNIGWYYNEPTYAMTVAMRGDATTYSKVVGVSFNDTMIIGWSAASDVTYLDVYANRGSYDAYITIGTVTTDSNGKLTACGIDSSVVKMLTWQFGITGTRTVKDGSGNNKTVTIKNGRITAWQT